MKHGKDNERSHHSNDQWDDVSMVRDTEYLKSCLL
jgi:hypothetical protein